MPKIIKLSPEEALQVIIKLFGGAKALADAISAVPGQKPVKRQDINRWSVMPEKYVLVVEQILEARRLNRHDIRPDIYPRDGRYDPEVWCHLTRKTP